jgi:hypothetical protein
MYAGRLYLSAGYEQHRDNAGRSAPNNNDDDGDLTPAGARGGKEDAVAMALRHRF